MWDIPGPFGVITYSQEDKEQNNVRRLAFLAANEEDILCKTFYIQRGIDTEIEQSAGQDICVHGETYDKSTFHISGIGQLFNPYGETLSCPFEKKRN